MLLMPFKNILPRIGKNVFIAPNAPVIGDVEIGDDSSIWFNCVLRGDVNDIKIGRRTNIQDGTVIHVSNSLQGTYIGDEVTVVGRVRRDIDPMGQSSYREASER